MIKTIFWDFDGVILDSMKVRDLGFYHIFREFELSKVELLMQYHRENGGLSRYVKIRHFFNEILQEPISDKLVMDYAEEFSFMMRNELTQKKYLIQETVEFIEKEHKNLNFHIVSGSDGNELRFLCKKLGLTSYFKTIDGSPIPKKELVNNILKTFSYEIKDTILIGDSINDYYAAKHNQIRFMAYNNPLIERYSNVKINF
tara:strand:+ start:4412 stop:5014 length:603 start_codon:yes stop_codon:yes gene_type:complete